MHNHKLININYTIHFYRPRLQCSIQTVFVLLMVDSGTFRDEVTKYILLLFKCENDQRNAPQNLIFLQSPNYKHFIDKYICQLCGTPQGYKRYGSWVLWSRLHILILAQQFPSSRIQDCFHIPPWFLESAVAQIIAIVLLEYVLLYICFVIIYYRVLYFF